jgi:hypothetical protein
MAYQADGYYYDAQLRSYILQFMAIFTGLQVQIGKWGTVDERLIEVPIHYGAQDRVVAAIMTDNTANKPLRLPVMSAYLRGINMDPARMVGIGVERRQAYVPVGGLAPDDIRVVYQRKPMPYTIDVDLSIYSSNSEQHFQILEQILPIFDPQLVIQTSDGVFDMTRLTHVLLKGINNDTPYPVGQDRRIIQSTLNFEIPIWIDTPADVRRNFVEKVFLRIGAVGTSASTNYEMLDELDAQGIPYEKIADIGDLPPM